jgi:hypothetical protein
MLVFFFAFFSWFPFLCCQITVNFFLYIFQFLRNDDRHLVFVKIFSFYSRSFMSDGPSKYERVIFQIGSQFSSELIQDGRAFWEFFSFFSNYHRRQSFLTESLVFNNMFAHKVSGQLFSLLAFFLRWQNCKMCFLVGVVFLVWDLQYCHQQRGEIIRIQQKKRKDGDNFLCHQLKTDSFLQSL